jgi:hypothetical protein
MSIGNLGVRSLATRELVQEDDVWVRPSEWPALTPISTSESKVIGLVAVWPDDNRNLLAFQFQTSNSGQYTVDWGDGTTENINNNVLANRQYTYSSVPGSPTSYGYKVVTVTVTPTTGGATFTSLNFRVRPTQVGSNITYAQPWLDLEFGSLGLTSLAVGANNSIACFPYLQRLRWASKSTSYVNTLDLFYYLSSTWIFQIDADMSNVQQWNAMFYQCSNMRFAPVMNMAAATNTSNMFGLCTNLISVPAYNLPNLVNMESMFSACRRLKTVPIYNTINVQNFRFSFLNCHALEEIPPINAPKATTFNGTFSNCYALGSVTISNCANVTTFVQAFNNCTDLLTVSVTGAPTSNCDLSTMFGNCTRLKNVELFETSRCNAFAAMFSTCQALEKSPPLNVSNATSLNTLFFNCTSLTDVSGLSNTGNITSFVSTFSTCRQLPAAPTNIDLTKATNIQNMLATCPLITTIPNYNLQNVAIGGGSFITGGSGLDSTPLVNSNVTNLRFTTTYTGCGINKDNLETIFTNLGSVGAGSQSITITGNPGSDTQLTKTATWTNNSNVVTMANTVGVTVGTQFTGTNMADNIAITVQANNTISTTAYIDNATYISFANVTTTNLVANTRYWVSNRAESGGTYYYQLSGSNGGATITFTSGSANMRINRIATTVNTNANVILSAWPSGNGTGASVTTRVLNTNIATFKGWSTTG